MREERQAQPAEPGGILLQSDNSRIELMPNLLNMVLWKGT
jgi:hypothetical protein